MLNKKELAARANNMKATVQASPTKDLKLKVVVEVVPSDDEESYSGLVFKRRRKVATEPVEHSASDGCALSPQAPPPNPSPFRDIVVQESVGVSVPEGGLWDPTLDAPSFLEKTLLTTNAKEKLKSLEEDQLVKQAVR